MNFQIKFLNWIKVDMDWMLKFSDAPKILSGSYTRQKISLLYFVHKGE